MEAHRRTQLDDRGLSAGGRTLPCYAGALHYWRVDPARWAPSLARLRALGCTLVETPVPWRVHEPEPSRFDWHQLPRFLELARAADLGVILRPGPIVNAELTAFGLPDHILADATLHARTARNTPAWFPSPPRAWPIPSYASQAFRSRVHAWYAALAATVRPHLAPDGPIVALALDPHPLCYRLGAFDLDYHPDAIAWWSETHADEPPRTWSDSDAARCVAWVRFKEHYATRAQHALSSLLDDVGLDLAHLSTVDVYPPRADGRALRRRSYANVLCQASVGFLPWFPPPDPSRELDQLLSMLAAGARHFTLAMAVERDRHHGAALSRHGTLEHATWIPTLLSTLADTNWPSLRRDTPIALVATRADARFGIASSVLDPMTPAVLELLDLHDLGTDPAAIASRRWHDALATALELAQVPYEIVDESADLTRYRAVIVPTLDRVDRTLWQRLHELKHTIVVIGPTTPSRDELGQPLTDPPPRRTGRLKQGSLDDLAGLAADLAALVELPDAWQIERPDDVRAFAHADPTGRVRVVFVASDSPRPTTAILFADSPLRDPFTNERLITTAGKASIPLPAYGVRMLIVD